MRRATAVAGAAGLLLLLGGCAEPAPCTAIGWSTSLTIAIDGPGRASVADVRICAGGVCSRPGDLASDGSRSFPVLRSDDDRWVFDLGTAAPDPIAVTLIDQQGEVLLTREQLIDWRLIDEPNGPGCGWRAESKELSIRAPEPRGSVFGSR
ncbi:MULTISPECIES: hypothetical protein [unclassified Rathayibacter]|uniref:hypothetical protein n=1 Tax=unclassified Rathayibacter TaxID=2609250 RepID=UPI0006F3C3E0|nr:MULTISPECIES: hypothetical protein [unclassified Rathayibacter]KQQ05914.1 hypothetical protein ASF42_05085 [Rathayibacter sp. Leaf294]KQS13771.1 hypothetical protein ASG06_05095 [Rathayibacter sp. Leaf185]